MLDHINLRADLLDAEHNELPGEFGACLNVLGSYSTERFVLRLSPRIHELIASVPTGIYSTDTISEETFQAYSTYLHETVHWWQHIGSSAGLILSLVYPAQAHQNSERLTKFAEQVGANKPIKRWAERAARMDDPQERDKVSNANFVVNNAIDLDFYKVVVLNPSRDILHQAVHDRYFESFGHCYWMAYGHVLALLQSTVDRNEEHLPDGRHWDDMFRKVGAAGIEGWVHGQPTRVAPFGLYALFEGQARMVQLQYLTFGVKTPPTCKELRDAGYFNGVYGEAFKFFLNATKSAWPDTVDDPIVALFLLIVDLAINPTAGFPLDIKDFGNFIFDVDPGIRFLRLTQSVVKHPDLLGRILDYSHDDYVSVATTLVDECDYEHPMIALQIVAGWSRDVDGIRKILEEKKAFQFEPANLVMRVLFSHYVSFCVDKLERPEFFCWPGAWMAGKRVDAASQGLFLKFLSLFTDRADSEEIVPRLIPGAEPADLTKTLSIFFGNIILYDLTRQWTLHDGPFKYDFAWLSQTQSPASLKEWSGEVFKSTYGIHPDACVLLLDSAPD